MFRLGFMSPTRLEEEDGRNGAELYSWREREKERWKLQMNSLPPDSTFLSLSFNCMYTTCVAFPD